MLLALALYGVSCFIYTHYVCNSIELPAIEVENVTCTDSKKDTEKEVVRVLVVDGGGVDGIMPLSVLQYLEEKSQTKAGELFDFYTGTSTGAIIISMLNIPDKDNHHRYNATDVLNSYLHLSDNVLSSTYTRRLLTLFGFLGPHLSISNLHKEFKKMQGGELPYHKLLNDVSITSFNLNNSALHLFNSWQCSQFGAEHQLADIITAATATPGFFSHVTFLDYNNNESKTFIDGVIVANAPVLSALQELFKRYPNAKKYIVVHLGTGGNGLTSFDLNTRAVHAWGYIRWILPSLYIIYKHQSNAIEQTIQIIQHFTGSPKFEYYYFNRNLLKRPNPFDTSKRYLEYVRSQSEALVEERKADLDKLAEELTNPALYK